MSRVRLHYYRTSRCQSRCNVAPGSGKGQREVARAEYGHRPERNLPQSQVGARQRRTIRLGPIDPQPEPVALANHLGKQPELPDRTCALSFEAPAGKSRFLTRAFQQGIAATDDALGTGFEESGSCFQRSLSIWIEGCGGKRAGTLDLGAARYMKRRIELRTPCGVRSAEGFRRGDALEAENELAGNRHRY
jgi:hypothetical protein